jgi:predicted nucleotidyltransferase
VVGGFCATNTGSVNNSYYDSEISGQADTGKGFPRTTKQMQEGYANSMIDGDSMYTAWDNDIWKFGLINKYPELK